MNLLDPSEQRIEWAVILLCLALPISIAATNMTLGLLCLALCWHAASGKKLPWQALNNPAFYALASYCAVSLLSSLTGVDPHNSLRQFPKDAHKFWTLGLLLLALRLSPCRKAYIALATGFAAVALFGIWQWVFQEPAAMNMGRRAHAFIHPVTFGEQMAIAFLGGLCFLIRSEDNKNDAPSRKWILPWLIPIGLALMFSNTRGAFIALAAGAAALAGADRTFRRWIPWFAAVLIAIVVAAGFLTTTHRTFWDAFRANSSVFATRFPLWDTAWKIFKDHPWLGVGPANYRIVFQQYFQGILEGQNVWGSAHNLYLHQLAERGILGAIALAGVLLALTGQSLSKIRSYSTPRSLWAMTTLIAFLVMNLTEVAFQNEQFTTLILFIWAWGQAD